MKIIKSKSRLTLLTLLFAGITGLFASCSKDDSNTTSAYASVKIVNAVRGSAAQDLYIDNTKLNTSAVAYGQSSDFLSAKSGDHQAKFTNTGSATANTAFTLSLQGSGHYTIYYTGNDTTNTSFTTQNDITAPAAGKAKVRFIQLSTALASAVDFGVTGSSKLATSLTYKAVTAYYEVDPNTTFSLYASGSLTAFLSIPAALQAGKVYTIYTSGNTALSVTYNIVAEN